MNRICLTLLLVCTASTHCLAQQTPAAAAESDGRRSVIEPDVRRSVIEDDGAKIEELRVRGQIQRIVVSPKGGGSRASYEIITGDGSRDLSDGASSSRGATGKRVWNVLKF
jgi:hypothetical protein